MAMFVAFSVVFACQASGPQPVGRDVTPVATVPPTVVAPTATPEPERNVAMSASISVSSGENSAERAIDGDEETIWSANGGPPQSLTLTFDRKYLVSRIELVVAQTPAGQTTHEIWLGNDPGSLTLYQRLANSYTSDGQTVVVEVNPPSVVGSVSIRTLESPSWTAWREVRVFGVVPPPTSEAQAIPTAVPQPELNWPNVDLTGDFEQPVHVTNAGDGSGRLFVVEQKGRIRVIDQGSLLPEPFLSIVDRVSCCGEQGLLGLVFPPDYADKQYFYVSYTAKNNDLVIARYHVTDNQNVADPDSEEIILAIPKPTDVHNGGSLAFGPRDGYLYIGVGDGGLPKDPDRFSQSPRSLLGKILRIDVESGVQPYRIPDDNPFANQSDARGEIWALGLRNPWRFAFDPVTGDLYIADVGDSAQEEVNFQPASSTGGENYGWPIFEGLRCTGAEPCDDAHVTEPIVQYSRDQGCSITGGLVYRGAQFPTMRGIYYYADFCSGRIWGLQRQNERWYSTLLTQAPFLISTFGEDEDGNLYVADYTHGAILRLVALMPSGEGVSHASPDEDGALER